MSAVVSRVKWSYGVMSVIHRVATLLPRTLDSLERAGFDHPHVFLDGVSSIDPTLASNGSRRLDYTLRFPAVGVYGNWVLSIWELYLRNPKADRFALFQDDFVTYRNLRHYLDRCKMPPQGYWNLYTFPSNQSLVAKDFRGWFISNQLGRGAVALVFGRTAVTDLFSQQYLISMPQVPSRGNRCVDGSILHSMKNAGWKEYVHSPSLVQHTGEVSTIGDKVHPQADPFMGESFDALDLL